MSSKTSVFPEPLPLSGSGEPRATLCRRKAVPAGAARGVTKFRSFGTSLAKPQEIVTGSAIMKGDLEVAMRDLQTCRSFRWLSQEMRIQLGRCLYELTVARRMCP